MEQPINYLINNKKWQTDWLRGSHPPQTVSWVYLWLPLTKAHTHCRWWAPCRSPAEHEGSPQCYSGSLCWRSRALSGETAACPTCKGWSGSFEPDRKELLNIYTKKKNTKARQNAMKRHHNTKALIRKNNNVYILLDCWKSNHRENNSDLHPQAISWEAAVSLATSVSTTQRLYDLDEHGKGQPMSAEARTLLLFIVKFKNISSIDKTA